MIAQSPAAAEPEEILGDLLGLDRGLVRQAYYGERSIFYNPGRAAPLGPIVASIKDRDGPNDKAASLSRPGVFRLAFQLSKDEYVRRFGPVPPRPEKGQAVDVGRFDVTRLGELAPHPVYAWMRWVQILSPTREQYESVRPLLLQSLEAVKAKWERRRRAGSQRGVADREAFVYEAELVLDEGADSRAPGGAITVELCGSWEHEGGCRWPHNTAIETDGENARLRTIFIAPRHEETIVRERIDQALRGVAEWTVISSRERPLAQAERPLAKRLARTPMPVEDR
jgi:hypothetical protein